MRWGAAGKKKKKIQGLVGRNGGKKQKKQKKNKNSLVFLFFFFVFFFVFFFFAGALGTKIEKKKGPAGGPFQSVLWGQGKKQTWGGHPTPPKRKKLFFWGGKSGGGGGGGGGGPGGGTSGWARYNCPAWGGREKNNKQQRGFPAEFPGGGFVVKTRFYFKIPKRFWGGGGAPTL